MVDEERRSLGRGQKDPGSSSPQKPEKGPLQIGRKFEEAPGEEGLPRGQDQTRDHGDLHSSWSNLPYPGQHFEDRHRKKGSHEKNLARLYFHGFVLAQEIIKIFLGFKIFPAAHTEIAESNRSNDKIQKTSSFLHLYILILPCALRVPCG